MLTKFKQKIQKALTAEAEAAHKIGLTPNRISAIGIVLALLSGLTYANWQNNRLHLLLATVLLLSSGFCDALDGIVARLHQQTTMFGGFLDSLLDRYADAAVYIGIIMGKLCEPLWGSIAIAGALLVSYSRARAEAAGVKMESVGLAERAERIFILAAASLTALFWEPTTVMNVAMILLAVLSHLTVLQRSIHAYKQLKKSKNEN